MNNSANEEEQFISSFLHSVNQDEEQVNKLKMMKYLDSAYRKEIEGILRKKYTLKTEDATEAAKDLYASAIEIFLMNIQKNPSLVQNLVYKGYIVGIARNLFFEKIRKNKEIAVGTVSDYQLIDEDLSSNKPFESEIIQQKVENALVNYFIENDLKDCLRILYYGWKKELKNNTIAQILKFKEPDTIEASRRVTVIQQNCMKKAWRNIPLLEEIKKEYHIRQRSKHLWQ